MGTTSSKAKRRDSGSVAPFSDPSLQNKLPLNLKSDIPGESTTPVPQPIPPVLKKEPSSLGGWAVNTDFNHDYTEGQSRRDLVSSCEEECSEITEFLFVGAAKSKQQLEKHNITRIVNLAPSVVPNYFEHDSRFTYLSIDMLDGRQDDISWFLCEVIQFIEVGRHAKQNTLLHCERGVSRSCSMAIAYIMWASESTWKHAFDYVKSCRASCAPNTGFTCNLIEIGDMLMGESRHSPIFFRCASHLPRDPHTPVLKLVRSEDSRKIILPRSSVLHSDGVFVVRPAAGDSKTLFVWKGRNASAECLQLVCILAQQMMGVYCDANVIELVDDGAEPMDFLDHLIIDGDKDTRNRYHFEDLFICNVEALDRAKRRRSKGSASLRRTVQTIAAAGNNMFIEDAEGDSTDTKTLMDEDGSGISTGEKVVGGEPGKTKSTDKSELRVVLTPGLKNTPKVSIVLKHMLSMDRSSDSSLTVERPTIRNLTSTSLADSASILEKEEAAEVVVVQRCASSRSQKRVRPKLYLCTSEDRDGYEWQASPVYDDDDLCEQGSDFLWVGRAFSMAATHEKSDSEVRGAQGTGSGDAEIWGTTPQSIVDYAVANVSFGDLGPDSENLMRNAVVVKQGEEGDEFWDKFYEGS